MPPPRGSTSNASNLTAYSLSLLSEYTHTLDSLPLDLSRNFADLRELDAVLSSSMTSITSKIHTLTKMIEEGTVPKEERLWLLTEIAEEAARLKLGGEDKIRVACQAADNLKSHTGHLRTLLDHVPGFDASTLNRKTTYPHVAARSFMPTASLESGRRRRGGFGSLLVSAPEPSPAKRKRIARDDDLDGPQIRSPRKEKVVDGAARQRNGGRTKKVERAVSPTESILSVISHIPPQPPQNQASSSRATTNNVSTRTGNGTSAANKRARATASANNNTSNDRNPTPQPTHDHHHNSSSNHDQSNGTHNNSTNIRRDLFNVPPSSSSHPSLPLPYNNNSSNGLHTYDSNHPLSNPNSAGGISNGVGADWSSTHLPPTQLEGPGMPVARGHSAHPGMSLATSSALGAPNIPMGTPPAGGGAGTDGAPTEAGDGDGDGDDTRTYCFCDGISYGEMIACDDRACEREWFHLACIGLTIPPEGLWYCETCRAKRNAKRAGRGGRRRAAGSRAGGRAGNAGA